MPIPTFTQGYPPDGSFLGETKSTIRNNLDGTFQVFSVDHQDQNETGGGSHNKVQLMEVGGSSPPSGLSAGFETLYSQVIAGAGEVFFTRGASGTGIQLTGPGDIVKANNGYTFLPGGLLLQWGRVNSTSNGTVTFTSANRSFPNACFAVWTQPRFTGAAPNGVATVAIKLNTNVSFDWKFITDSGAYAGFLWIAIGN